MELCADCYIAAYSIDQMLKDIGAMMEELLVKTLVQETVVIGKK
jgi:hypothetical protein